MWLQLLAGVPHFSLQGTAFPVLIGNNSKLFKEAGSTNEDIDSMFVSIAAIVGSLLTIPLAKAYDRKTLLEISSLGVSASLFALGAYFSLKNFKIEMDFDGYSWIVVVIFLIYIGLFMVCI